MSPAAQQYINVTVELDLAALMEELEAAGHGTHTEEAAMAIAREYRARTTGVRRTILRLGEQMYRSALGAAERAESELADFDRHTEGALAETRTAVEIARRALSDSRMPGAATITRERLAFLEADLKLAEDIDRHALQKRLVARAPLEAAWRTAATETCNLGLLLDKLATPGIPSLVYIRRAAQEKPGAGASANGANVHGEGPSRNGGGS